MARVFVEEDGEGEVMAVRWFCSEDCLTAFLGDAPPQGHSAMAWAENPDPCATCGAEVVTGPAPLEPSGEYLADCPVGCGRFYIREDAPDLHRRHLMAHDFMPAATSRHDGSAICSECGQAEAVAAYELRGLPTTGDAA